MARLELVKMMPTAVKGALSLWGRSSRRSRGSLRRSLQGLAAFDVKPCRDAEAQKSVPVGKLAVNCCRRLREWEEEDMRSRLKRRRHVILSKLILRNRAVHYWQVTLKVISYVLELKRVCRIESRSMRTLAVHVAPPCRAHGYNRARDLRIVSGAALLVSERTLALAACGRRRGLG